jgi:hypothetical protein
MMGMDSPRRTGVHVAAFGKHPGWDDHIEDIGLDHELLVQAKRVLYTEGMAGNIDSGAWDRLPDDQRLPAFKHTFWWKQGDLLIVGRMWSSRDGKGRSKYPMCVAAMVEGVPSAWAISRILARLAEVENKVTQTSSAELVRLAIGEARRALEDEVRTGAATGFDIGASDDAEMLKRLIEHPAMFAVDGPSETLTRILYEIDREMGNFRPASGTTRLSRAQVESAMAAHIRVPRCLSEGGEAARAWIALMGEELADKAPVLVLEPQGQDFLDIIVGEPRSSHLFCVRASVKGLAPASDVPYSIEPSFASGVAARVEQWRLGRLSHRAAIRSASNPAASNARRKRLILAGIGVVTLIVLGLALRFMSDPSDATEGNSPLKQVTPTIPDLGLSPPDQARDTPAARKGEDASPSDSREGDPRVGWDFDGRLAKARAVLAEMVREYEAEGRGNGGEFARRLDRADEKVRKFIRTEGYEPKDRERLLADMRDVEREVGEVEAEARSRLMDVHERIRAWLEERANQPPVTDGAARALWAKAVKSVDATRGWAAAKQRVEELSHTFPALEREVAGVLAEPLPALLEANTGAIAQIIAGKREETLRNSIESLLAGDSARASVFVADLRAWVERTRRALSKAAEIEHLLAAGCGPDEDLDGETISGLFTALRGEEAWKEFGVALGPLAQRCEAIQRLGGEKSPKRLLDAIRQAREDQSRLRASEAMTAWRALAEAGWPATIDDLRVATKAFSEDLGPVIARVSDTSRRTVLREAAQRVGRAMWRRWVIENARDDSSISVSFDAGSVLGIEPDRDDLPAWVRFNFARHVLAKAVDEAAALSGSARDAAQRKAIEEFVQSVQPLAVASEGSPKGLLDAIEPLRRKGAELDLAKLGPGSAGWKLAEGGDGERVVYLMQHDEREWRLEFRRVEPSDSEVVSYLGTTEVSVGQFAAIVDAAGRWEEYRTKPEPSFLPSPPDPAGLDPRAGARSWVWSGGKIEPAKPVEGDTSSGWLRVRPSMTGKPYYPDGLLVEPPSWDSPMQQVGPVASALTAKLAGCRLPTANEWRAAVQISATVQPNLRDASWKRVYDHIRSLGVAEADYPGSSVFRPVSAQRIASSADNTPAVFTDDGVVWFLPVGQGNDQAFLHLVGNVAEFVFEEPSTLESAPATREGVRSVIGQGEKVGVIGASALSPPEVKPDEVYLLRPGGPKVFSDVGFRLAFSAPREAGATGVGQRLKKALDQHGYLQGGK